MKITPSFFSMISLASLIGITLLSGIILSSSTVSADNDSSVDDVSITVPVSCTLSGTGMNSHTATIASGTYESDIGTTTLKAYCNDNEGFSIYAIGYTDNTDGKNVLTSSALGSDYDITTGTGTSGNSQWAMKLGTVTSPTPTPTYPINIQNNYNNYHTVPNDYDLVAKRTASTDTGEGAEGSTLTTTYQVFVNGTQPAGTYTGQVKYVMVHPSTAPPPVGENQIGVIYDGNGLFFDQAGTKSTNRVVYEESCEDEYGYIGDTPTIYKTRNLNDDGTKIKSYADGSFYEGDGVVPNANYYADASRVKIVIHYGLTSNTSSNFTIALDGNSIEPNGEDFYNDSINRSGTLTYVIDAGEISFYSEIGGSSADTGYDYGIYIQVYPIYDEPTEGASYGLIQENVCSYHSTSGAYAETTTWKGEWFAIIDNGVMFFGDQLDVLDYISENNTSLLGSNLEVYAYNPYTIHYNGNGATAGTMNGFYTTLDTNTQYSIADLMAYNFKKTGYGFAGWSPDQNATVNSNSKIYGPNEKIVGNELNYDNNRDTTLYAVWVSSAGNLQDWSGCSSMSQGQVTALTDTRDNNVYTVGKMQDGECWMMENLRLDAANSNDSTKAQGFGGVFTGLADSEDANFKNSTTTNSKYSTSNIGSYQSGRFPRFNNNNTNIGGTNSAGITLVASPGLWDSAHNNYDQYNEGNNNYAQWYGYGNYYTWAAAMANTASMANAGQSESANTSICPAGWKLPYGSNTGNGATSGGFSYLDTRLGGTGENQSVIEEASNRWRAYPNNFLYSGGFYASSAYNRGCAGYYWSSTAYNDYSYSYYLYFSSDYASPGLAWQDGRYSGFSVRCLADN